MTSLIPKTGQQISTNNNINQLVATAPSATTTTQAQPQPQIGLSPEAKSTLLSGVMSSVLGATWLAAPKVDSANKLVQLSQDKFEATTKKLANSNAPDEKLVYEYFKQTHKDINTNIPEAVEKIFGKKETLNAEELAKAFGEKTHDIAELENKIKNAQTAVFEQKKKVIEALGENKTITDEVIKKFGKDFYKNKKLLKTLKDKLPVGTEITNEKIYEVLSECFAPQEQKIREQKKLKALLSKLDEHGNITKTNALSTLKQHRIDTDLEMLKCNFETIKSKLPKARLKGAAKWFGIGLAVTILSNMVFSMFGRGKSSK